MPLADVSEVTPHRTDETTQSLIDEGKLMPGDYKISGSDTQTLLSRVEHYCSATFLVCFAARHIRGGAVG